MIAAAALISAAAVAAAGAPKVSVRDPSQPSGTRNPAKVPPSAPRVVLSSPLAQ